ATFEDKAQGQQLCADTIKVWLTAPDKTGPAAAGDKPRPLPHHLEATGHVRTTSPDLRVPDTERLEVRFHDGPPITPPAAAPAPPGQAVSRPGEPAPKAAATSAPGAAPAA